MHFSIPDTQELLLENSLSFTVYNIYINGSYHCSLRYKQLHALHEILRRRCNEMDIQLPNFPPKRLLPLTNNQLEARRIALEQYLQLVGQDMRIAKLEFLQNFLLNAQLETAMSCTENDEQSINRDTAVHLDVALMNGYHLQIENFRISCNSSTLLHQACDLLRLPKHFMPYFCLFLARREAKDTLVLLRLLMDFESPYLSYRQARPCQILFRKCYWDPAYDLHLLQDTTALNLLYMQTESDVDREWIIAAPEVRQKLQNLQDRGLKKEYLEVVRQLPLYGCLQFIEAPVDYPDPETTAIISIGNKELSMRTVKGEKIYETKFRVTRMRCWRVTAIHNTQHDIFTDSNGITPSAPTNLQLAFEYLMSKQNLRWITITSAQAMLMSVCLQSMVDELLSTKSDFSTQHSNTTFNYRSPTIHGHGRMSQSQSQSGTLLSSSSSTPSFSNEPLSSSSTSTNSSASSPTAPVKFFAQEQRRTKNNPKILTAASYAAVFFPNAQEESVQNEAFEGIGDDDL